MKANEKAELDYNSGYWDGDHYRKKGKPLPKWYNGAARGAGNPVSPPYGEGFRDGVHGKSHRYEKGKRKRALV